MTNGPMFEIIKRQHQLMLPPIAVVEHARREMRERRVGVVLVTDDEQRVVGSFAGSDADSPVLAEGKSAAETRLPEVMTRDPEALALGRTTIEALRLMQDCGFRRVPVVAGGPGRGRGLARRLPGP
jgi:CBS domain-containing protein